MCHQSIEKILKAVYCSKNTSPAPYSHSLSYLAKQSNLYSLISGEHQNFLDILEPLNIEARYPSQKEKLMQGLTREKCRDLLYRTKELHQWIKKRL